MKKRNLKSFTLLYLSLIICSCKQSQPIPGIDFDTTLDLLIINKDGKNLLDSNTIGYYNKKDIKIYYMINGQKTEVYNPTLDAPRNFYIFKNESKGEYYFRVFVNSGADHEITSTYIQWRDNDIDTVKALIVRPSSNIIRCNKIWYNGIVTFDYDVSKSYFVVWGDGYFKRFAKIIK